MYYFRALFPSVLQGFRLARNNSKAYYFNMLLRNALRLSLCFVLSFFFPVVLGSTARRGTIILFFINHIIAYFLI